MRCWNMSVQYWLANYVYKRFSPRRYGTLVTMLVSAYWHGFHAGYYLSFLTVPLVVAVDDLWAGLVRKKLEKQQQQRSSSSPTTITRPLLIYDWVNWFLRCRAYDYMCMGFLMLSFERTIKYWRSIYFLPHIAYALLLLLGLLLKKTSLFHSIVDKDGRTKRDWACPHWVENLGFPKEKSLIYSSMRTRSLIFIVEELAKTNGE